MLRKAVIWGVILTAASLLIGTRYRVLSKTYPLVGRGLGIPIHYVIIEYSPEGTDWTISEVALVVDLVAWSMVAAIVISLVTVRRKTKLLKEGKCVRCGYDLRGLPEPRCPECGAVSDSPIRSASEPIERPANDGSNTGE